MPRIFKPWPRGEGAIVRDARGIRRLYEDGAAGCELRPTAITAHNERFDQVIRDDGGWPIGEDAARVFQLEDFGDDKLCLNFVDVVGIYPEAFPGPAQERGDCVSHSQRNADLVTVCCEITRGEPDSITGLIEGAPDISTDGQRNGCFSSEWSYWHRGSRSDGWICGAAAIVSTTSGAMVRRRYSDALDLTTYSGDLAGRYGRNAPPEEFETIGRQHLIRTATRISGVEQLRDFIAAGFGVSSCGAESFSSARNEHGVSRRTRSGWSHSMAITAVDARRSTIELYGSPLFLIQNSWGKWNRGSREIRDATDGTGTPVLIPHGSFWARWPDIKRRTFYAMSSAMGWKPKRLHRISTRW